jgi:hypothetical protein
MKQPEYLLNTGTRVRTHDHEFTCALPGVRRRNAVGKIKGVVGGMGGDVYWVDHDDGARGAYCFDEFELEPESAPESEREAKIVDVDADELLVTWNMVDDSNVAVILEPLKSHCAALDLSGIAALRAALDKAEAAYKVRNNLDPRTRDRWVGDSPEYRALWADFDYLWGRLAHLVAENGGPEFRHADTLEGPNRQASMNPVLQHVQSRLNGNTNAANSESPNELDTAKALLKRTIPALNMAIRLADTTAHWTAREQLRNEVAAAVGPFNPYENSDMHYTPDSWEMASARSRQLPEADVWQSQAKEIIGKAFQYPDPPPPGPGMRDIVFQTPGIAVALDIGQQPEPPIPAHALAEAEKLVRAGYVFEERVPNAIVNERDADAPLYMLTTEQMRIVHAAMVNVSRETLGQSPVYMAAKPMSLGQRIRQAREASGLNGFQVAHHVGTVPVVYERYERDIEVPDDARLEKLATLFSVSIEELKG